MAEIPKYHKIQTVFKRDPATKFKTLLIGEYALPEFEYLSQNQWVFTEKVDGTNIRVNWDGELVRLGGRTDNAQIPAFLVERLYALFTPQKLAEMPAMTLYGEGYGKKIQKGGGNYKSDGVDFVLFDVFCGLWLERESVVDIAEKLELHTVPVRGCGTLPDMVLMAQDGFESDWGPFPAEGIVARPLVELLARRGDRVITKIKHKDFCHG